MLKFGMLKLWDVNVDNIVMSNQLKKLILSI